MATITTINATDLVSASRTVINTNFSNLNTAKVDGATALTTAGRLIEVASSGVATQTSFASSAVLLSTGSYADPAWLTSLATSKLSGTVADANLASTAVTPAAYGAAGSVATFTVDAKGRITAAASVAVAIAASQVTSGTLDNARTTAASTNTVSAIVARDASGNFAAGTITATFSGNLTGNVTGNASGTAATITGALALANTPLTTRGDLLVATTATPILGRLAKGTQYQVLLGGATDPTWGAVDLAQASAITGILPVGNGGTGATTLSGAGIVAGAASITTANALLIGASAGVLGQSDATFVSGVLTRAGTLGLSATGANVVTFSTNGVERGRFTSAGEAVIGASGTAATWGTAGNAQTALLSAEGGLSAISTTGEHFLKTTNSGVTTGTRGNVLALWASGNNSQASAVRFLRGSDGAEVGAAGYISASGWYADNSVYLAASIPYALADGSAPLSGDPPNLVLGQEGYYSGALKTVARLKFGTDWSVTFADPNNNATLSMTALGNVTIAQKVGIGTAPDSTNVLQVNGAIGATGLINAGTLALTATGSNPITFSTNGNENMRLVPTGRLGIGTSSPGSDLTVRSPSLASVPALGAGGGHFALTGDGNAYGLLAGVLNNGASYIQVQNITSAVAYPLTLQPNAGNVLIGTTTDDGSSKLQVAGVIYAGGARLSAAFNVGYYSAYTLGISSLGLVSWANTDASNATKDIGFARASAGLLEVNNGTAGTYRDLLSRSLIGTATAAATLANSQFTFHLASDTSLVVTAKGSDGTLRSVALTLAP